MNNAAMFQLTYGLFVLTAKDGQKENGCIVNTVQQVTTTPNRISVAVNKNNYTHDMIAKTGQFNVSILSEEVPFELFKHFGFQSGRDVDKFANLEGFAYSENQIPYICKYANAYLSGKVVQTVDLGTHTLFIADVTDGDVLSNVPSVTYAYYHKNIKPQPQETKKSGWRCKICGYIYEGDELPADFVCPICKHGAADFEKI
jgi:flavin reductase (DIM6/NTAB) family NADH-FMN oxidoreductase RutF